MTNQPLETHAEEWLKAGRWTCSRKAQRIPMSTVALVTDEKFEGWSFWSRGYGIGVAQSAWR